MVGMVNFLPLATSVVSAIITLLLWRQFITRRKLHQLVWAVSMSLFTLGAALEFLMNPVIMGPSETMVKIYYLSVAPQVSLLGTGVLLLISAKWGRRVLPVIVALSVLLIIVGGVTPIDLSDALDAFRLSVVLGIRDSAHSFPSSIRIMTVGLNIYGATTLIGGGILSYVKDKQRTYTLLFSVGGILNGIGGGLLGLSGNPDIFLEFELLGAIALFGGFLLSQRLMPQLGEALVAGSTAKTPFRFPLSRRLALAAVFGAIVFTSKLYAPPPVKDSVVVVQALLLGLGALLLTPLGATLVATIGGLLTASWRPDLALFTIVFAVGYGLLIDGLIWILRARRDHLEISARRFTTAVTLSTASIGLIAYGTTVTLGLLPRNLVAEVFILVGGTVSGLIGGYLAVIVWRRAAKHLVA